MSPSARSASANELPYAKVQIRFSFEADQCAGIFASHSMPESLYDGYGLSCRRLVTSAISSTVPVTGSPSEQAGPGPRFAPRARGRVPVWRPDLVSGTLGEHGTAAR